MCGRPRRPRIHLFADRPDLPAEPRRAGGLQRREVRRRLLAEPRGGAAAQARLRRRADRDRPGPARARPRLRVGRAARLHPPARRDRRRRHAVLGAARGLPRPRARRPPLRRPAAHARGPRRLRRGREPRRVRALLLAGGAPCGAAGGDLPRPLRPHRERPARRRPAVPADDGLRAQHDPGRGGRHLRAARLRRLVPRADGPPVPRLVAALRAGAGRPHGRAGVPPRVERERPPRLHPDHPRVAPALRRPQPPQDARSSSGCCRAGPRAPSSGSRSPQG